MADQKISQLTALTTQASADELVIVDSSATQTKKITVNNLFQGIPVDVGIGTISPVYRLGVATTATNIANFDTTGTAAGLITFSDANTAASNTVRLGSVGNDLAFYTNTTGAGAERMRIDSSGNVGIGTSSPASAAMLTLNNDSDGQVVLGRQGATQAGKMAWPIITATGDGDVGANQFSTDEVYGFWYQNTGVTNPASETLGFRTNSVERMRIASGGTLMVGKTSSTSATVGVELRQNGVLIGTASGIPSLLLNRTTSDGSIVDLQKDGSTVGNIGTNSGNLYIGNGDTTLLFAVGSDAIIPRGTSGASRDGSLDLGNSANRFKDLYLSGGVYLGGTAAANKLDDYEEGTWTPTLTDGTTTVTQTNKLGSYVKVGNIVSVYFQIVNASVSGLSGGVKVGGLPFTTGNTRGNGIVQFNNVVDGPEYYAQKSGSNAFLELKRNAKTTSETAGSMITSNFSEGVSDLFGSVTYTI